MSADFALHALLGLLPVCCFLAALMYLDSYKLIPMRWILGTILLGCIAAIVSYPINIVGLEWFDIEFIAFSRYVAPIIEEALKALVIITLLRRNRIGFLVDAAIFGFAVGTGFAIFENLFYLQALPDTQLGTWIVRGFGTAFMHGGTTAIFRDRIAHPRGTEADQGPSPVFTGIRCRDHRAFSVQSLLLCTDRQHIVDTGFAANFACGCVPAKRKIGFGVARHGF